MKSLHGLTVRIWTKSAEDVAVIFADPTTGDLESVISDPKLVTVIHALLWSQQYRIPCNLLQPEESLEVKLEVDPLLSGLDHEAVHGTNEAKADKIRLPGPHGDDLQSEDEEGGTDKENVGLSVPKLQALSAVGRRSLKGGKISAPGKQVEISSAKPCHQRSRNRVKSKIKRQGADAAQQPAHQVGVLDSLDRLLDNEDDLPVSNGEDEEEAEGAASYPCDYCDFVSSKPRYKMLHEKRIHLNLHCKTCKQVFKDMEERDSHTCVKPDRFQCHECEKSYRVKGELKKHIQIIHRGVKFPCDQCKDVLSSTQSLRRHIRTVHESLDKKFRCHVCSKDFKDNDYLQRHLRVHESTEKSFVCQECGKFFKYKVTLRSHIRTMHEGVLKQACEDCGKRFADLHKLKVHREMVHMIGELLVCQLCGKEMLGKNRLRNHMMTHPKGQKFVACNQCGREVPETQMRSHVVQAHKMAQYKYQCDYCPKRLDTKAHIRAHIRKHTGARPYLCRGCGKYYPLLETAQKHTRIFHSGDYSLIIYDINKDINNPYVSLG